jgi:hypothetical protein
MDSNHLGIAPFPTDFSMIFGLRRFILSEVPDLTFGLV